MYHAPWMLRDIPFEQAVYGSFPFWHRGYAVLARSAGCRDDWLMALKQAAQRFGEPPPRTTHRSCLFALPLSHGPWMIVGVFPQGCDDQGRPGALAFHGLFVGRWSYRRAGASPFAFAPVLRGEWAESDRDVVLPTGSLSLRGSAEPQAEAAKGEVPLVQKIVDALKQGRKIIRQSDEPIDGLARGVWRELPRHIRRRASVATWAYCNENRFDLLGMPRILAADRHSSHLILEPDEERAGLMGLETRNSTAGPP